MIINSKYKMYYEQQLMTKSTNTYARENIQDYLVIM